MVLPVLVALSIFAVDRLWVEHWAQSGTELVSVQILDARSNQPIVSAVVELTNASTQVASTSAKGKVAFAAPYNWEGQKSLLRGDIRHAELQSRIRVSADGYEESSVRLTDYRQGRGRDGTLADPIVIRLEQVADPRD